jgi:hypothetical protein
MEEAMPDITLVPRDTYGVWVDGAGRAWPLDHHMVCRVNRTYKWICDICDVPVTMFDVVTEAACLPRIGGDSANGYEAYHKECLNRPIPLDVV